MQNNLDLFDSDFVGKNYLPYDGVVEYIGQWLDPIKANLYFQQLWTEIEWQEDLVHIAGKYIQTKRKIGWYADRPFLYHYSGTTKQAKPWHPILLELKQKVEYYTGEQFNACLLNLYHSGEEGVGWHSDSESELEPLAMIASLSLGAPRRFVFKHKQDGCKTELLLAHGSLLLMSGETQKYWLHSLPKVKGVFEPRINLTFRKMLF